MKNILRMISVLLFCIILFQSVSIVAFADEGNITIPANVTPIEREAFSGDVGIKSITIPAGVTGIGIGAFSGCTNLSKVYYEGTKKQWEQISIAADNAPLNNAELLLGGTPDAELSELVWKDFADMAAEVDADAEFYQIADWDLYMWIPSIFVEQELTEEDAEYGYISYLTTKDESAAVGIIVDDSQGMSLEEWENALNDAGYETEIGIINGIKALVYEDPETDSMHVLYILLESNQTMEFIFWPMSDEGFEGVAWIMTASLQAAEKSELVWEDFADMAAEVDEDAGFYQIADWDLYMWIPSIFVEQELTEEDVEYGYISYLTTEDEDAAVGIIMDDDQGMSLEEWGNALNNAGYETEIGVINGIKALIYEDPETDSIHVLYILRDSNQTMEFYFWPMSDEGFASVAWIMIASLQAGE